MRVWCELAWLGGEHADRDVIIEIDGDRIASVTPGAERANGTVTLHGLTIPGLANAHSHSFQRALRGRTQRATGGSFWTWREQMYGLAGRLDEARYEALARATFAEMALGGITLVGEFDYMHHSGAVMRAAAAAGVRLTLIDACYLEGGIERFRDESSCAWATRVAAIQPTALARVGAAIHSVRAVPPDAAAVVAAVAGEHGWPLHAHVSEQPAENDECLRLHGCTPLELLGRAGAVGERFTAVHATHLTTSDAERLRDARAFCCLCPTTERDLADGIGAVNGRLTLGSDSQAVIDLFEEARAVELDLRLRTGVRGTHGAASLAVGATANGYTSLGWPEGGRIAPGALADLVTVSLDGPRLAGTAPSDALDSVIFAGAAADVHNVIVGGREIVRDGVHLTIDVAAALSSAIGAL